jgi:alkylation response protein AidB-like acyl-CoA dehydrogenase
MLLERILKSAMAGREERDGQFFAVAELFEQALGDPVEATGPLSFRHAVEIDEREAFPLEACGILDEQGVQDYYVPTQFGGNLHYFDEIFTLLRIVARRDLSVAIAHSKTFLGAAPIWIAGSSEQRQNLACRIQNREPIALALTEEAHGSDLAASECTARKIHDQYFLTGSKWLVNNATRGTTLCLLGRTRSGGGPLGTSLFYVEKEKLDTRSFFHLPKIKTHGIRGIDISGIQFENAVLPAEALVGKEHHGLEYLFKTFQITRPLCSALSLGAADTALRLALRFALERRIYNNTVFALPTASYELTRGFTDILICECLALFAARALQVLPEQMSLWSAITKYFVPTLLEETVRNCATILGARYYLREHYCYGIFQKIVRDIAIVGLFDGSSHVNLNIIAGQLGQLTQYGKAAEGVPPAAEVLANLEQVCTLRRTMPDFDPGKLLMTNRGRDELQRGLLLAEEQLDAQLEGAGVPRTVATDLRLLIQRFAHERRNLERVVRGLVLKQEDMRVSVKGFALSKTYCILHAAAACYYIWLFNRSSLNDAFASGEWLVLCLSRLLKMLFPQEEVLSLAAYEAKVPMKSSSRELNKFIRADQLIQAKAKKP